ncbi:l-inducible nipa [Chlorella sorokiniana]|uniref:L-inducible nipa n=1 Tax=Chlorella sorokiniana TaxID=3076 RepID=A0A2P6TU12_CHLSO|nr:l-inducible nipa [Chlorella sorokiniana]|eukprot:PRW57560.1 l-inducible nipa [Chlorella sorokiniana]
MLRATARLAPRLLPRAEAALGTRGMSMAGMKGYDDREAAEEMLFFKKEDEKLLRKLLSKVRSQAAQSDPHAAAGAYEAEKSQLKAIVGKYNISDADLKALIEWKHEIHH